MLKFAISTIVVAALLAGCQSSNKSQPVAASVASTQAVKCSKCDVTWVQVPETQKGRVIGYSTRKEMTCPDCKDAVQNFFATGKLQHTCTTCGDSMELCQGH